MSLFSSSKMAFGSKHYGWLTIFLCVHLTNGLECDIRTLYNRITCTSLVCITYISLTYTLQNTYHTHNNATFHFHDVPKGGGVCHKRTARHTWLIKRRVRILNGVQVCLTVSSLEPHTTSSRDIMKMECAADVKLGL